MKRSQDKTGFDLARVIDEFLDTCPSYHMMLSSAVNELKAVIATCDDLDCGDQSCLFARDKSGQRTNGGCRCISNARPGVRQKLANLLAACRKLP